MIRVGPAHKLIVHRMRQTVSCAIAGVEIIAGPLTTLAVASDTEIDRTETLPCSGPFEFSTSNSLHSTFGMEVHLLLRIPCNSYVRMRSNERSNFRKIISGENHDQTTGQLHGSQAERFLKPGYGCNRIVDAKYATDVQG